MDARTFTIQRSDEMVEEISCQLIGIMLPAHRPEVPDTPSAFHDTSLVVSFLTHHLFNFLVLPGSALMAEVGVASSLILIRYRRFTT